MSISSETVVRVDLSLYSREAVMKVTHRFLSTCDVEIEIENSQAVVQLTPKRANLIAEDLRARFLNELLDQTLRDIVATETEGVRNLILAHALSNLSLIGSDLDSAEPFDDPLEIFIPDERKSAPDQ